MPERTDPATVDGQREADLIATWVEAHLGARVTRVARQPRWRPVWFVDVEDGDGARALCVRGERLDFPGIFSLPHEMTVQALLDAHGIPVPHVYGWCDDPRAFVTDLVPGCNDFASSSDAERESVMDHYMAILAEMHQLDLAPFVEAGVTRAPTPAESGVVGLRHYELVYRANKKRPDPFLEFCLGWLARHPVETRGREAVVVWDSGQFHHLGGRIVALLDLELAHIGDPMMDLAGFRQRDTIVHYGDMNSLYDRYATYRGEPVDLDAVQWHHFAFTLSNELAFHAALAEPTPGSDYMTNLQWCSETNLFAVEALAEILGIELREVEMPEPRRSLGTVPFGHLVGQLRTIAAADAFEQYRLRTAFRLARHLQRVDEIGDAVVEADLDDLHRLLGRRPATFAEGDAELERFVLADEGRHDEELVQLFHARLRRAHMLLGPPGSAMATHHTCQPFTR